MTEVSRIRVPPPLRQLPIWLCWTLEGGVNGAKQRKTPYYASGGRRLGRNGSPEDRAQLVTFGEARAAAIARDMRGVGMALLADGGYVALDFDDCFDPLDGSMPNEIADITRRSYAEFSPSGKGVRVLFRGNIGNRRHHPKDSWGLDVFSTSGFVTITGDAILGAPLDIADIDEDTRAFVARTVGGATPHAFDPDDFMAGHEPALIISDTEMWEALCKLDPSMAYPEWIRTGMAIHHQFTKGCADGQSPLDGLDMWNEWSSYGSNYPATDGYNILKNFWDRFDASRPHPIRFSTVLAMGRDNPARPEVAQALRDALVRPTPEEIFSRLPPPPPYLASPGDALQSPSGWVGRFRISSLLDTINMPPMEWHIRGLVPVAELGMLYGPSTVGKSFMALDMAAHIALGRDWHGYRVRQGKVLYVAAEGSRAFGQRIRGWCEHHKVDEAELAKHLAMLTDAPDICNSEQTDALIDAIKAIGGVATAFFDTFARITAGHNENDGEQMGAAIANAQRIYNETGATVILIHHPGKDLSLGARGWSGIKAALDFELLLLSDPAGNRDMRVSKMKDGDDGLRLGYRLDLLTLTPRANDAVDPDTGEVIPLTSRVISMVDIPKDPLVSTKGLVILSEPEKFVLDVVDTLPITQNEITHDDLLTKVIDAAPGPMQDAAGNALERDTRRVVYGDAIEQLLHKKARLRKKGTTILIT